MEEFLQKIVSGSCLSSDRKRVENVVRAGERKQAIWMRSFCCSVTKSCLTLCDPMDCSTPGFPVLHYLPEFVQTHVHWVGDVIQPSHLCHPLLLLPSIFPSIGPFPISWLFASDRQSIGVSASPSVFPLNIQDWFPLGLTGLISLQSKGFSRVFFNTTVQKHQFFWAQFSL